MELFQLLCHKWDCVNGSTLQSPGLYWIPGHFNGLRTNIQHLFALQGDMSASTVLYLNLQFILLLWKIMKECHRPWSIGRCGLLPKMPESVSYYSFISRGVKAFMNYPLTLNLCSRCYRRDSLCICYGGRWWWWRRRRVFFKNNS